MKREAAVFITILVIMTLIIDYLKFSDEVWLISGISAALALYWITPPHEEGYLKFTVPILLLLLGAYFIAVKLPKLISGLINYQLAELLCLAFYVSCCWLFIKRKAILKS